MPKNNRTGRPRKRPYAAHDGRAVAIRARNAQHWLQQLRWRLDAEPEVLRHLYVERRSDIQWLYANGPVMVEVIDRLALAIDVRAAADEGQADV
jgi:alpha-amylase/alpha-mannosidase (GH57 family)